MSDILKGKVAIVTGAGRGIGKAVATLMASEGARVLVNDYGVTPDGAGTAPPLADEVVKEIEQVGGQAVANYDTVATEEGGKNIVRTAVEQLGGLHVLVNNAGIVRDRMIFNLTGADWDDVIKVHLYGHFYCTRSASIIMRQQKYGRVVNISSGAGLGILGSSNYAAAKEGIIGFTRGIAHDLRRYNVTCNAVRPVALTRHFDEARRQAWLRQGMASAVGMIETSEPEDLAPFIVYLCSEEAAAITGRTFSMVGNTISLLCEPRPQMTVYKNGRWTLDELRSIVPNSLAASLFT